MTEFKQGTQTRLTRQRTLIDGQIHNQNQAAVCADAAAADALALELVSIELAVALALLGVMALTVVMLSRNVGISSCSGMLGVRVCEHAGACEG